MTITRPLTSSGLRPINQRSNLPVREQTVQILRDAILNFELRPGQRLIEREFIDRLGISRTTFREALRELSTEGLVTVVAQKGARVSTPTKKEAADLYEIRAALESLMVTRFIERATDAEIKALAAAVDDFEDVVHRTTDTIELLAVKESFYRVLLDGAHSPALEQVLAGIKARVRALRSTSLSKPGRANETVDELRSVVEAVARRDARAATELNRFHVQRACAIALSQLPGPDLEEPESTAS